MTKISFPRFILCFISCFQTLLMGSWTMLQHFCSPQQFFDYCVRQANGSGCFPFLSPCVPKGKVWSRSCEFRWKQDSGCFWCKCELVYDSYSSVKPGLRQYNFFLIAITFFNDKENNNLKFCSYQNDKNKHLKKYISTFETSSTVNSRIKIISFII